MLNSCSMVKSLLMILVVLGHSCLFFGGTWLSLISPIFVNKHLAYFAEWLNSFHIYAFTLISGYLFYYLKYESYKAKYHTFFPFIFSKLNRLLVPYFFISILWVLPLSFVTGVFSEKTDLMHKFLFGCSPSQLWFLLMLFWVFVMAFFLSDLWKKKLGGGIVVVIIFYCLGAIGCVFVGTWFQFFTACLYLLFFFMGFKIRQHINFQSFLFKIPTVVYFFVDISLFVALSLLGQQDFYLKKVILVFGNMILHIWGSVGAFVVLSRLTNEFKILNIFAQRMQKYTMSIYLLHQQIIYVVLIAANGYVCSYFHALLNFIISMILSIALSEILLRFKFFRFIMGGG